MWRHCLRQVSPKQANAMHAASAEESGKIRFGGCRCPLKGQDSDVIMHSKTLPRSIILRHVRNGWQYLEQKLIASLLPLTEAIQCVENGKFQF
jgi:hypothetical protein